MSKDWTGERLETFIFNENTIEHLHRYALACSICKNSDVLDIACGEGYGSNLLSKVANKVTGVDISGDAVDKASKKYQGKNIKFLEGSASEIPLDTNSMDVVVSFETLEHHDKHQEMMNEIKRILKPGGILIMSSPDKKYYTDVPNYINPFHVKELYFEEFKELIHFNFKKATFFFQKMVTGSLIIPENTPAAFREFCGNYEKVQVKEEFSPVYNMCIASNGELPYIPGSLFDGIELNKHQSALAIDKAVYEAVTIQKIAAENAIEMYKNSWSYKLGHLLLSPLRLFRRSKAS